MGASAQIGRTAIYATALLLCGVSAASAQDICPKGRNVQQIEMMQELNRRRANVAFQHGQVADGRAYMAEVQRLDAELLYGYLDQELATFPLIRNPNSMLAVYG